MKKLFLFMALEIIFLGIAFEMNTAEFMICLLIGIAVILFVNQLTVKRNKISPPMFFNKLKWRLQTGEMKGFSSFQIDVFCFVFEPELSEEMSMKFTEFADRLDVSQVRSVMMMFVWLYQHNIKFRLVFAWNEDLSALYNVIHLFDPMRVRRLLYAGGHDDLMSCPLDDLVKRFGKEGKNL